PLHYSVLQRSLLASLSPSSFFFFTHPAPTEIYSLSLHDALPISGPVDGADQAPGFQSVFFCAIAGHVSVLGRQCLLRVAKKKTEDRKSTRLNSSHDQISYAVFCLKKKKKQKKKKQKMMSDKY